MRFIKKFLEIGMEEVALFGGKNASLGELIRELQPLGVNIPPGFATTSAAYRTFLQQAGIEAEMQRLLKRPGKDVEALVRSSNGVRKLILSATLPAEFAREITDAYEELTALVGEKDTDVAVRSSATAEDLPNASFAGQQETFLNVRGKDAVLDAVKRCFASLFTPRAISYREDMGFGHFDVALSAGVQKMVRSDLASAGVIFTLDTESGHRGIVLVTSSWGLGENIVQGRIVPDQFVVHKEMLQQGHRPILWKKLGSKELRMVYAEGAGETIRNLPVTDADRNRFSLDDDDILRLSKWAVQIEQHYSQKRGADTPMDLEWAKDGRSGELYIVQARPETVQSQRGGIKLKTYRLDREGELLASGAAVGDSIASGRARVILDPKQLGEFQKGEILVAANTDPDWEPIMKLASAIVTDQGGRTSHAAIVSRELGVPAVVGTGSATRSVPDGETITVSCAEADAGRVFRGELPFRVEEVDAATLKRPRTKIMLNVAQPEKAFRLALLPSDGIGLARVEFVFAGWVGVHPLALTRYDTQPESVKKEIDKITAGYASKTEFFIDKLAQGIGILAGAFWPRPVILRFSDFKTNEYAKLLGGAPFEPKEENPMIGWRGASRYYHPEYKEGFLLEVAAVKRVREAFGLKNLKVMIPFCRTPAEGEQVLAAMAEGGLERGRDGLEVYVMAEIPSNVLDAGGFAQIFDGFSIGSNDLTQLVLGVDRDSYRIANLFDERNPAVKRACAMLLETAHANRRPVGICGQAPSDYPDFAAFLVEQGIDSISLNPDAVIRTMREIVATEERLAAAPRRTRDREKEPGEPSRPEAHH